MRFVEKYQESGRQFQISNEIGAMKQFIIDILMINHLS